MQTTKKNTSLRSHYSNGFIFTAAVALVALFFQYVVHPVPCPLCLFQRNIIIFISLIFLIAFIHNPVSKLRRIYALLLILGGFLGALFAGRHAWLQYNFDIYTPDCGPTLDVLMNRLPFIIVIERVYQGKGDCTEVLTTFLQLPLPFWSFIIFSSLVLYSLLLLIKNR